MEFDQYTKRSDEWATPLKLFRTLNAEFRFQLDVAANAQNAKCKRFYDKSANGLDENWAKRNWCNPPYSQIPKWVLKARREQLKGNMTVMLLPARTDTKWFHDSLYNKPNVEVRFIPRRVVFEGAKWNAPFPSMIVILKPHNSK
jgi:phage N-6-adenine-methyltransferase